MLVLSRKVGEAIMIGDRIRITVEDMRGGKVRIGIVAPPDVVVDRQEIHDKKQEWVEPVICQSLPTDHQIVRPQCLTS